MSIEQKLMTADELMSLPDNGHRYELIRGELRTMSPSGFEHSSISIRAASSLLVHVEAHDLGEVVGEPGFRLAHDPDTVRSPDVGFVRRDRVAAGRLPTSYFVGVPDLAIEVISPNDLYTEVDDKVAEWLEHGTLMVLVVNPRRRTVAVHRPGQPMRTLTVEDTIDGEDVVPGWRLAVRDLFGQR